MSKPPNQNIYEFEDYRLDAGPLMLSRNGEEISLPPKVIEILLMLVERRGTIVSKDALLEGAWPDVTVEESNLYGYLHVLRNTLGDQSNGKPFVETLRRRGYRFNCDAVVVRAEDGDSPSSRIAARAGHRGTDIAAEDALREGNSIKRNGRKYLVAGLAALALAAAGFSTAYYWRGGQTELAGRGTEDFEAWDYHQQGRYHLRRGLTRHNLQTSIEFFQKAISRDPKYSSAHAGLARAFISLSPCCDYPSTDAFPKAKTHALRALETDDQSAEAHSVMAGILFWYDWNWASAEEECRLAIKLDPNSADAHFSYAHLLSNTGRHAEALAEIELARTIEPGNLRNRALEGLFLKQAGRTEEALDKLLEIVEVNPEFWLSRFHVSSIYIEKGNYTDAIAQAEEARKVSRESNYPLALKGYALAKSGRLAEARTVLDELNELRSTSTYVPYYYSALVYNGLGESEKAITFLERAREERESMMVFLRVEPKWNNLRFEQRFIDLLKQMNLK